MSEENKTMINIPNLTLPKMGQMSFLWLPMSVEETSVGEMT